MLVLVHFADLDQLSHDLRLKAGALCLRVDLLDVLGEGAFFLFEPFDTLDQRFELINLAKPMETVEQFPFVLCAWPFFRRPALHQ
jgi:hypothetical protein